jgi:hypothetical protein
VYAVLPGNPVITLSKVAFDALVASNGLRTGYWYVVTGAYTDGLWSYVWDMLGICISNNSLDYARTFWRSTTAGTQWLRGAFDYATDTLIFAEVDYESMTIDTTQAAAYDGTGTTAFKGGIEIVVITNDIYGNAQRYFCKTNSDGTAILNTGSLDSAYVSGITSPINHVLLFANDVAVPVDDVNFKVELTDADLLAGGAFSIDQCPTIPIAGGYWIVQDAALLYTYNSSAYDNLDFWIETNGSPNAPQMWIQAVVMTSMTTDANVLFLKRSAQADEKSVEQTRGLQVRINTPSNVGDGSAVIFGTARFILT